jgi:hypothetical protein
MAGSTGTGVPFIFQIVLLLVLPPAFVYLICVAGLVLLSIRATLKNLPFRPRRRQPDSPSVPRSTSHREFFPIPSGIRPCRLACPCSRFPDVLSMQGRTSSMRARPAPRGEERLTTAT